MLFLTLLAAALGLAVGLLRGGSLERLAALPIRWPWVAALAWVAQVVLFTSPLAPLLEPVAPLVHGASLAVLAVVMVANRHLPGLALFGAGLLLNALVFATNGGFMPVSETALRAAGSDESVATLREGGRVQKTFLMASDTPLWFLADVIPVRPFGKVYSIGDVVAAGGVLALVAGGMGTRRVAGARRTEDGDGQPSVV